MIFEFSNLGTRAKNCILVNDGLAIGWDVAKLSTSDNDHFDGYFEVWVLWEVENDRKLHLDLRMDTPARA